MKSILLSVNPKWVQKILSGEKTIEIRKTAPKEVPVRVYMYCTKGKDKYKTLWQGKGYRYLDDRSHNYFDFELNGKVVAEFVVDKIDTYAYAPDCYNESEKMYYIKSGTAVKTCLLYKELRDYGKGKTLYGWHISDLKVYNEPLELGEFHKLCEYPNEGYECYPDNCNRCPWNTVTRPPQSYMHVRRR